MLNILFWNLYNHNLEDYIIECLAERDVDIAVFSEFSKMDIGRLEDKTGGLYKHVMGLESDKKITMLVRGTIDAISVLQRKRYSIYHIDSFLKKYIVLAVHLEDRHNYETMDRIETIKNAVADVENIENDLDCSNTLVIGDFNANFLDEEMISKYAFNSILYKKVIEKNDFTNPESYRKKRFYNPILQYLSEDTETYGSYFFSNSSKTPYWYCLDQLLVRKQLVNSIHNFEYIKGIKNEKDLLIKDIPNKDISDHLPLYVEMMEV